MLGDTVNMGMSMLIRSCANEPFDDSNGCHDLEDVADHLIDSMQLGGTNLTVDYVSGDYCVCSRNNCNTD